MGTRLLFLQNPYHYPQLQGIQKGSSLEFGLDGVLGDPNPRKECSLSIFFFFSGGRVFGPKISKILLRTGLSTAKVSDDYLDLKNNAANKINLIAII